jgi:hypothetical protein
MRGLIFSIFMMCSVAGAAWAEEVLPRDPDIESVISGQIEAFRAEDLERAFAFAGPGIQRQFATPENFGAMVRGGYPMVWRPAETMFGALEERGGWLFQNLFVTDTMGRRHLVEYHMVQIDGVWRIAGVRVLEARDLSA